MELWKKRLAEEALRRGIIDDPGLLARLDEPMPVWAVLQWMIALADKMEKLGEEYSSYD